MTTWLRLAAPALVCAFLVAHLWHLPRTLEDIDSINFALGVESFDVAAHRPHPPGYPVYIGLAKATTGAVGIVRPSWDRDRRAAVGLSIVSVAAGAVAVFVIAAFWRAAGLRPASAFLAAALAVVSPLFWVTAGRPLSDTSGLVAAVGVQALLLLGTRRAREDAGRPPRLLWLGFAAAGVAAGIRAQTVWLTGPLAAWSLAVLVRRRPMRDTMTALAAAAVGIAAWALPLVRSAGGVGAYVAAVRSQGAEDLSGVEMLATVPSWPLFSAAIVRTFVDPWQAPALAYVVLGLSVAGAIALAARRAPAAALVAVCFLPYLAFHLAFQETATTRYALPLVVPVAGLAVAGLETLGMVSVLAGSLVTIAASLALAGPALDAYARGGSPLFRAFRDMRDAWHASAHHPTLYLHHQVWWGVRRIIDWYQPVWKVGRQPFPGDREWLAVVRHFQSGHGRAVFFLAHPTRPALAAFDPRATTVSGRYDLPERLDALIGGVRLNSVIWHTLQAPGWMVGRGWALNPEIAGMTDQDRRAGRLQAVDAFVRRAPRPLRLLVGGRHLGGEDAPPVALHLTIDGRIVRTFTVPPRPRWFVQWLDVPGGTAAGPGRYAQLVVDARTPSGDHAGALIGLEQFDAASADTPMIAFGDGWHEAESDPATGASWRWTSAASALEVRGMSSDRTLTISGESPLRYFSSPPVVTVRAGVRVLATFSPAGDFTERVTVPAAVLARGAGTVTIETSRAFSPSASGSPDRRTLGLRLFSVTLR